ncbi:glycosyltransferase family 4 protein [Rufibacter latericius]|uniref:Glycosyltransferase family 1 protein n=1 Tax=Rufibacter latericius TaxID=2487040 RepID=A0A3M9MJK1_9BACT|nr:glycosyltransferase family 4 protein [Rufibacter latericius]RNI25750.1 glycosyltransferase family 1 protein [Rufibacter latericius]
MKVLHVQKVGGIAGSENYLLEALPALVTKGLQIEFLCLYNSGNEDKNVGFINKLKAANIKVHTQLVGKYPSFSVLKKIKALIQENSYDIIHTHLVHADFFLALVKMVYKLKFKHISTKHGYEEKFNNDYGFEASKISKFNLYYQLCMFAEKYIDRSYAISNGLKEFFINTKIAEADKIDLIHYGFDFSNASLDPNKEKYRFGDPQLVIVGRLVKFKGHRFLLKALPDVLKVFPSLKLIIVGGGSLDSELKEYTVSHNLSNHVIFTGYKPNIHDYMLNSDVVLVPSISEGFGVVFLEAFNNRKPVIAFDVPAANEIIENNISGILVPPYDTSKLSDAIVSLLSSKSKMDTISANAYQRLGSYFNLDRMIDETLLFYKKVLTI